MAKRTQAVTVSAATRAGDLVGYARVSTRDQRVALQLGALGAARCGHVFEETASGAQRDRPQLAAALDYMRAGDTLVVWKLDRLARSTKQLIETAAKRQQLARELDTRVRYLRLTGLDDTALVATISDWMADFEALLDAAGPGSMDSLAGRLPDLRHYASLLTAVAAVVRDSTIRVPK